MTTTPKTKLWRATWWNGKTKLLSLRVRAPAETLIRMNEAGFCSGPEWAKVVPWDRVVHHYT